MRELKRVWNHLDEPAEIFVGAGKVVIEPGRAPQLPKPIADQFLKERPGHVIDWQEDYIPDVPGMPRVWLANNTGNPDFPPTYKYSEFNKKSGKYETYEEPHPLHHPRMIKYNYEPGQIDLGDGINRSRPARPIHVPPYDRVSMPQIEAQRWLTQAGFGLDIMREQIIAARAPSPAEPDESWHLNNILAFGLCMDDKFMSKHGLRWHDNLGGKAPTEAEVFAEKLKALRILFFLVVNPLKALPPEVAVAKVLKTHGKAQG